LRAKVRKNGLRPKEKSFFLFLCIIFLYFCTMEETKASVQLSDLSIGYRQHNNRRVVAKGLSAPIYSGQLTCLLGRNGVGKSTLLRTLSAFQPPLDGSIMVDGRNLSSFTAKELARTIGVVLTERPDVQQMTVRELVAMGRSPYTGFWGRLEADDESIVDDAMNMVGIAGLSSRLATTLSDGERQKVMIAKALAQQTPVVYLDEPTAFLDYPSKVDMLLLLRRISREAGKTVFLSTHDVELALQVADCLWLMQQDGQLCVGTPRKLAQKGVLARFVESDSNGSVRFIEDTLTVRLTDC
jgi:iron complex transport system ATP-binding protein